MGSASQEMTTAVEATVTSKGQVTLPKELRTRLGIHRGSRIRFTIPASGLQTSDPPIETAAPKATPIGLLR